MTIDELREGSVAYQVYPVSVRAIGDWTSKRAHIWLLTEAQIEAWVTLFPTLDVRAECRAAWVWIDANPTRRKTARGMKRFLGGWLIRSAAAVRTSGHAQSPVCRASYDFVCRHTPHCGGRNACRVRTELEDARASQ